MISVLENDPLSNISIYMYRVRSALVMMKMIFSYSHDSFCNDYFDWMPIVELNFNDDFSFMILN